MKFFADVQWWDSSYVHVLCFFCGKIHSTHRASHCHNGLRFRSYHFKFPFPQKLKETAYEIDKANKRYVALGASPPQAEQDSLDEALAALKLNKDLRIRFQNGKMTQRLLQLMTVTQFSEDCDRLLVVIQRLKGRELLVSLAE